MLEYERLKENDLFSTLKRSIISDDTITILVHNVRSLSKHVNDIVSDSRIMNNDILGLISLSDSTCRIVETLNFNDSEDNREYFMEYSAWSISKCFYCNKINVIFFLYFFVVPQKCDHKEV